MIPEIATALLLAVPLVALVVQSVGYWSEFRAARGSRKPVKRTSYPKVYFYLLVLGVLCMWVSWVGSIILLVLGVYHTLFGSLISATWFGVVTQGAGLLVFSLGALTYNWSLAVAGKYLRPAPSGIHEEHRLIQEGPYGVIRHPLYVSYILILAGLSLALLMYWLLIPVVCILVGIYPTAKAEEEVLVEQFWEAYIGYQRRVGMLFPRLS
jgi:protein-S-isoprenylcysteine O-methyltransferase Ste14